MNDETSRLLSNNSWYSNWKDINAVVLGASTTGFSVADTLIELGMSVTVIAANISDEYQKLLHVIGANFYIESSDAQQRSKLQELMPHLVIVSPGYRPDHEAVSWIRTQDIVFWSDMDLAWRLRDKTSKVADWIMVTGTNGKTTTTQLTAHIIRECGKKVAPVGNIGISILDAIRDPEGFDVLVVELSSFQLHYMGNDIQAYSSVCLNIAEDHLSWHDGFENYVKAKSRVYQHTKVACVYNRADDVTLKMVESADVQEGARAIGFGLDVPDLSDLGIVDGIICDRAFVQDRKNNAHEIITVEELKPVALDSVVMLQNVMAASALARSYGVDYQTIRNALSKFMIDRHRQEKVALIKEALYVNDSKATNIHAAQNALMSYANIIWICGGDRKGVDMEPLISSSLNNVSAVIIIGKEQQVWIDLLKKWHPNIPIYPIKDEDSDTMKSAVHAAYEIASPGSTVLLSPATASFDQFKSYEHRGDCFVQALEDIIV